KFVVLLVLGLGRFIAESAVTGIIGIAGGVVLAWMGWGMIKSVFRGSLSLKGTAVNGKTAVKPVTAGILSTLANPYWFLWWATVGAGYVALSQQHGLVGVLFFFGGHILADLSWLLIIAALFLTGKKFISDRFYTALVAVLGAFLVIMAAFFFWTGITWL
ncbi:MAG: LysE family transporter, partial [Firmicutes bacterium]|nr:LysE family transporter [Bacillota bacterium]